MGKMMGGVCVLHDLIQLSILFSLKNVHFCLCCVFVAVCGLSLVAELGLLIAGSSLVAEHRP